MKLERKLLGAVFFPAFLLAAALGSSGCSGLNASHSVSPASFLLPGLMQADPPPAQWDLHPLIFPDPAPFPPVPGSDDPLQLAVHYP